MSSNKIEHYMDNCSNDFYSNIISYGTTWGPNNQPNNAPKQTMQNLNNMGQIIVPYPATVRPKLFLNNPPPHAFQVNNTPNPPIMQNCNGYRVLREFCPESKSSVDEMTNQPGKLNPNRPIFHH